MAGLVSDSMLALDEPLIVRGENSFPGHVLVGER
jgi:hypothetical protein